MSMFALDDLTRGDAEHQLFSVQMDLWEAADILKIGSRREPAAQSACRL